ncbi:hypothetical protein BDF21DRAFT_179844 [Thamnidium elegans]|nr:hypothetical protein BDF21DRAFT_179844 [Thamnidium elegans]
MLLIWKAFVCGFTSFARLSFTLLCSSLTIMPIVLSLFLGRLPDKKMILESVEEWYVDSTHKACKSFTKSTDDCYIYNYCS